ncbi:MAG: hypothetical protein ACO3RC_06625 [Candidatus Nanopelagicaceae bacterium]
MLDEEVDEEVEGAVEAGAVDVDPPEVDPPEVELVEEDDESLLAARESVL